MTGKTHLVLPDSHAHPKYNNDRALLVAQLISDLRPDVVVNLGDMWDMASMSNYEKGRASFVGRNYRDDLDAGLDFDDKLWYKVRKNKKRKPYSVFLEGNHEFRMKRALDIQPELQGVISFKDYDLNRNYDEVVEYEGNTPGVVTIDGIDYAHYFTSGVMGRPIGGEHPAYSLLTKQYTSCTCGHIHVTDFATRTRPNGKRIIGCVAGVFQDYNSDWAGEINKLWWRGLIIKRNVQDGNYDPEWVSIERLKQIYG
ncbi:MAG: metallophosphoesterase [Bdellovibrionales bacterium]|nr:metallophosphoesterase [Bdellovibrionales bacterium]